MNIRRVWVLFKKELFQGPRGFIFIWAIVMPVILSFFLGSFFSTLTSEEPKIGVFDRGDSELTRMLADYDSMKYREYTSETDIREAIETGMIDTGIVIPEGFDLQVKTGAETGLQAYVSGESLAKNRTIITVTITSMIRDLSGQDTPVEINLVPLGDREEIPWSVRLLPLLMLFAVFLGGVFIPSTSLIDEKVKRTLTAVIVTPASAIEVFAAKGLLGFILSLFVGVIVLVVNGALGSQPLLLVMTLALGGIMAVGIGLILGTLLKDISTLFAIWKSGALLLMGPAFIYMFPQIPQWISRIFPTYYMLEPLMDITQTGAGWSAISMNILILTGIDIAVYILFVLVLKRSSQFNV
ncbi:MAG: ABC transporter permease [Dehalococcoidales bacterium]|nr:ABC transporter permease [Dehalococcoidales bacterium]